jgi:putative colanic acid biosysnthesis UDP-glucose lipid carrier transferase
MSHPAGAVTTAHGGFDTIPRAAASLGPGRHSFTPPPLPVSVSVAAVLEPALAVLSFLGLQFWFEEPMDRAARLLCVLTLLLMFPGVDRFQLRPWRVAAETTGSWLMVLAIMLLCGLATNSLSFFKPNLLVIWALLTPALQTTASLAGGAWLRHRARQPEAQRPALVIGAAGLGAKVAAVVRGRAAYGHQVIGFLEDRDLSRCAPDTRNHVIGGFGDVLDLIRQHNIKDVYITLPLSSQPRITKLLQALHDSAVSIYFVPDVFGVRIIQGRMRSMDGVPVVSLLESPFTGVNGLAKRASDLALGCLITLLISPVLLGVAIGVKLSSPGPVIFQQRRNGLDGEEIIVYKFRSMRATDDGSIVKQATRGDSRITPFGAFIRKTSLDELPQFINVLQGRMSIVGPRPHAVAHNDQYKSIINAYMLRHKVKPGITGWAQVNGHRGETDVIEKMEARVAADIEYLRNWSLKLDLQIISKTVKQMFFDRNAY